MPGPATPARVRARVLIALVVAASAAAGCAAPAPADPAPGAVVTPGGADAESAVNLSRAWSANLSGDVPSYSSPLLVDVTGDGFLDVLVGSGEGHTDDATTTHGGPTGGLVAYDGRDGRLLWEAATRVVDASPALGDVSGDGEADAVVGLRSLQALALVDPVSGDIRARLDLGNWVHSAALADVDSDGTLDAVVVTGGDDAPTGGSGRPGELLVARGASLEPLWRVRLPDEAYSSPAVGDVGDGRVLVLHGLGGQLGKSGAFEARVARSGDLAWREEAATGVLSSPALADLDGDGAKDVVYAEWWGAVHARRALDGAKLWDAETRHLVWTSPALADLDGDGAPDVLVSGYRTQGLHFDELDQVVNGKWSLAQGVAGVLVAYEGATGKERWRIDLPGTPGPAVTADLSGDGRAEVLVAVTRGDDGYFGREGADLLVLDGATGREVARADLVGGVVGTPAVGDVDGDGRPEIVLATMRPGNVVVLTSDAESEPRVPWAWTRWRGNERATGEAE